MEMLTGWVGGLLGGVALTAALAFAGKSLPKLLGSKAADALGAAMANVEKIEDPVRQQKVRAVAKALVEWAEYEIPDKGQGRARYEAVAAKLTALIPALKGKDAKIADIIENAVAAMDAELKKVKP
jgi:hypothetical protein